MHKIQGSLRRGLFSGLDLFMKAEICDYNFLYIQIRILRTRSTNVFSEGINLPAQVASLYHVIVAIVRIRYVSKNVLAYFGKL